MTGIILGNDTMRPFVNLIVAEENRRINIPFLVDSGTRGIYLSGPATEKLGFCDSIPRHNVVDIYGF